MRMVINADDLGMSADVNAAIANGIDAGWVTSVSILTRGPAFADAVALCLRTGVDVGVHLDATEFYSPGNHPEAARAEWAAQLATVRRAGLDISHLDSHHHIHYRPPYREILRDLARDNGISRIRAMGAPVGWWRVRARTRAWLHNRNIPCTTEAFYSLSAFVGAGCPRHASVEIMIHPGNPHSPKYQDEVKLLSEGWLASLSPPLELISWAGI